MFLGDEDGGCFLDPNGVESPSTFNSARQAFSADGETWVRLSESPAVDVWSETDPGATPNLDPTTLFADPAQRGRTIEEWAEDLVPRRFERIEYSESREGGLYVVRARPADCEYEFQWTIDPDKDWLLTRREVFYEGKKTGETRFSLERLDGQWFPARIENLHVSPDGTPTRSLLFQVLSAEFNRPEHPKSLALADIGLEPGMLITYRSTTQPTESRMWDGASVTTIADWTERLQRGEVRRGPSVEIALGRLRAADGLTGPSRGPRDDQLPPLPASLAQAARLRLSEWEGHVRRFIIAHSLDSAQAQRAWTILRDCQADAESFLVKRRERFEELQRNREKTLHALPVNGSALERIDARFAELREPLDRMFENRLKPRIEGLLTTRQRQAASSDSKP